jgi:MFS family permease
MNVAAGAGLARAPRIAGVVVDALGGGAVLLFRVPLAVAVGVVALWPWPALARGARPSAGAVPSPSATLILGNVLAVTANAASFAIYVFVPYYLIDVVRHPATIAGVVFMTVPLSTSLGGLTGGWLTRRVEPRHLVVAGLALETLGLLAITMLREGSHAAVMVAAFVLTGFGLGLFQVPNMTVVMAALPDRSQGLAGGMISAMRTVGILAAALLSPWLFAGRQAIHRAEIAEPSALFQAAFADTFLACTLLGAAALALAVYSWRR